ncbi:tetratricopeptide repeat protein [Sphingomonas profundi]|uniref:tetratricopeptide repeat protein n=1 Tax=Alterirhizorhabdus profundi TaxID=2681549 RepID=UPI0012E7669B|nr:tetratricopeptide repeat protein [Sphingomonas profundi]
MLKFLVAGGLILAPLAGAHAGVIDPVDPDAYAAISNGRYAAAETRLTARVEHGSNDPAVLINLAHLYARDGRGANAAAMYREVLAAPNERMELADGSPAWSHDLAQRGLRRLTSYAAR